MLPDNPHDQARLFYLAILGLAIASSVVYRYRGRLGTALQHAAIWALIFAGAVLIYGFKDQLARQLHPDQAAPDGNGGVVLRRATDGHFHAEVAVNGTGLRFLVDTGASGIVLSRQDAARVGIDLGRLSYVLPTMTANGRVMAARVRLDRVALGPFTDRDVAAVVNGGDSRESLLGMDYLDRFGSLRIEGDRLILTR